MADPSIHSAIAQAVPVVIGGLIAMGGGLLKACMDFLLEQRKQKAAEERAIRAEQREEERKESERKRANNDRRDKDEAVLLMLKTQLRGSTDIMTAAGVVMGIHEFFIQRPHYLDSPRNQSFLEKYPQAFRDKMAFDTTIGDAALGELKSDAVSLLSVSE